MESSKRLRAPVLWQRRLLLSSHMCVHQQSTLPGRAEGRTTAQQPQVCAVCAVSRHKAKRTVNSSAAAACYLKAFRSGVWGSACDLLAVWQWDAVGCVNLTISSHRLDMALSCLDSLWQSMVASVPSRSSRCVYVCVCIWWQGASVRIVSGRPPAPGLFDYCKSVWGRGGGGRFQLHQNFPRAPIQLLAFVQLSLSHSPHKPTMPRWRCTVCSAQLWPM